MTFNEFEIAEPILRAVREKGYQEATPIQEQAIPVVMTGKDLFGIAQTGTGKTAAFAIPVIQKLMEERAAEKQEAAATTEPAEEPAPDNNRRYGRGRSRGRARQWRPIKALVLTPTRELAMQISECFTDYGKYTGLRHTVIFGGVKQGPQAEKLRGGVDILIATPGRLLDLMGQGLVKTDQIKYFVLDEADRMLDMGFIGDIRRLLPKLPKQRQTLFFSATLPDDIVSLSRTILDNPVRVEVAPPATVAESVDQCVYFVEKPEKKKLLLSVLKKEHGKSVLIFSRTKHGADNISRTLRKAGIQSEAIHGDKSQGQRQKAMTNFKAGKVKVMVATDIASRGIDIKELEMVINYDLPDMAETYVHRIGRTGRAGNTGTALTFCSQDEHMKFNDIQKLTGKKLDTVLYTA